MLKREKCKITTTAVQKFSLLVSCLERQSSKNPDKMNKDSDKLTIKNKARF